MRCWAILVLVIFAVGFVSAGDVDVDVIKAFDSGDQSVEVIIELDDVSIKVGALQMSSGFDLVNNAVEEGAVEYRFGDIIAAEIDEDDLNSLSRNFNVKSVVKMERIYALLQDSVDIINVSPTWALKSSGINLTGVGQSVCVIDSGVNYSHPDLSGSYLGGYDFVDDDDDPMDGFGHGTHVAGIVAASGGIMGVAPGVGIVGVRVLNNVGSGSPSDLASAIDWCVGNASEFNISVISMSLGCNATAGGYDSYCDAVSDGCFNLAVASSINAAIANNISVLAATGNFGGVDKISSPACIQNVTAVSSVDKDGSISSFSDRNSLVNLLAPGALINSTRWDPLGDYIGCNEAGNYMICSGTSMATPMVSGVVALISQYLNLSGQGRTPAQIESILNDTGLRVDDTGGSDLNFSVVDAYAAMISLDIDAPDVALISPVDNNINLSADRSFVCNATDWQLANVTLSVWNSSGLYYNETKNLTGVENETSFDVVNMSGGVYSWNCLGVDALGNSGYASANFSLTVSGPKMIVIGVDGFQYNHYVDLYNAGVLTNFSRLVGSAGWNGTHNITGHSSVSTAAGNAELQTGLNETLNGVSDNTCDIAVPDGTTIFERLENFNSDIVTGSIYGKDKCYVPNGVLRNAHSDIDWWQNRSTYSPTAWSDGTACDDSKDIATKATEFIGNYSNSSFYLFVYFGAPDCSGHAGGDDSVNYNNSFFNIDDGLGILLDSLDDNNVSDDVQILVTADHGWNDGTTNHGTANWDTIVLPLITNNASMVLNETDDGIREQCEIAPTVLDYFGLPASNYSDIVANGCDSMISIIDNSAPLISVVSSSVSSSGATITWTTDESSNSSVDYGSSLSLGSASSSSDFVLSHSIALSGLSASSLYYYNVTSCDSSGNCANASGSFTTSAADSPGDSSPGGSSPSGSSPSGSSASSSTTTDDVPIPEVFEVSSAEVSTGYTKSLKKDEKVNFSIFDSDGARHLLTVNEIGVDYVNLTIESDPVNFKLGVGQSVKFNLTSADYYDLMVKLNSITNDSAELTIQLIDEPIEKVVEKFLDGEIVETVRVVIKDYFWVVIVLAVVLVAIVYVVIKNGKAKKLKGSKAKKKNGKRKKAEA